MKWQLLYSSRSSSSGGGTSEQWTHNFIILIYGISFQPMKADNAQKGKAVKFYSAFLLLLLEVLLLLLLRLLPLPLFGYLFLFFCYATSIYSVTVFPSMFKLQFMHHISKTLIHRHSHTRTHIRINFELKIRDALINRIRSNFYIKNIYYYIQAISFSWGV